MTVRNLLMGLLASGAIVACTPKAADAPAEAALPVEDAAAEAPADEAQPAAAPEANGEDLCKAAEYASLIGANAAAVTLPADLPHRIYKLGDPVTMDYRPDRLNIVTDADGVITEVKCG
jgi:hypothetical protein